MDSQIIILTLIIDPKAQLFFNDLRKTHFPVERNYLDAHLTLFHNLPGNESFITDVLERLSANTIPFDLEVTKAVSIGNGVAYKIESADLQLLHKLLQQQFKQWLIPQDKQTLWPHITIQNKVAPIIANQLLNILNLSFHAFSVKALGIEMWEYKNGPWQFISEYRFKD